MLKSQEKQNEKKKEKAQEVPLENLPNDGLLRIRQVLLYIPVSKSSWWSGVKTGRYPQPMKLSQRVTVWKTQDIKAICNGGGHNE